MPIGWSLLFLIAALGVENKLPSGNKVPWNWVPETKTHETPELGASVSITITIDIGRPRAVVRQRRIEGLPKHPDKDPGT